MYDPTSDAFTSGGWQVGLQHHRTFSLLPPSLTSLPHLAPSLAPAEKQSLDATWQDAATCVICGAIAGLLIGITAEYYTSNSFKPVLELVRALI